MALTRELFLQPLLLLALPHQKHAGGMYYLANVLPGAVDIAPMGKVNAFLRANSMLSIALGGKLQTTQPHP